MFDLKEKTRELLSGSIIEAFDGTGLYTPDGMGNYHALWTRDFAYMVEYAGDLMPDEDKEKCIEYLLNSADKNGWIPDRVDADGNALYTAGGSDFPASPNLDNGCLVIIAAICYLECIDETSAKELFGKWKEALCKGVDCLPKDSSGLVCNKAAVPHSPYGFTDCIAKTGLLSMESILLWKSLKLLVKWLKKCNFEAKSYMKQIELIEQNFSSVFSLDSGLLLSSTEKCSMPDLWASCFALAEGFPLEDIHKEKISKWFCEHYDEVTEAGQLRHVPKGMYWEETFEPVEEGTYQNGAFWATPAGWLFETLMLTDKNLAKRQIEEILDYFEKYGVYECVNGEYKKLDKYVASITGVYHVCKKYRLIV